MENITKDQWKELVANDSDAVVVDVRTPGECSSGVIQNAVQLDLMDQPGFTNGVQGFDKSKNYYVYCRSGSRSEMACRMMEGMGLNTYNLIGGVTFWDGELVNA